MVQTSGTITPIEDAPIFLQKLALLNPLYYYHKCLLGVMLKGVGLEVIWPHVLALAVIAIVLQVVSALHFRRQLG